ncbi:MAG: tRNA(Ile)-lysidine synthase [Chlamydiae bacterium]|nr:tRNA(Ile)-lysidine synthase [Chlamydiota bacterium]
MLQIEKLFAHFFEEEWDREAKLLLGFSGGPDSRALFHLLLEGRILFEVAHVDHGWREESRAEAASLRQLCDRCGVTFHLKQLNMGREQRNLEELARKARLSFFRELCVEHELQAVLLGHHADDQAETVLKRVFEGASLPRLRGLTPVSEVAGVTLWRPLLAVTKEQILAWLHKRRITPFFDQTNQDPRFLRGRLRSDLLPYLSKIFGKEVSPSLCRLGNSSHELAEFLESLLSPYRERVVESDAAWMIDLSIDTPKSTFEWKVVVRDFLDRRGITVSTKGLEALVDLMKRRKAHKTIAIGRFKVGIDRGRLSVPRKGV